MIVSHIVMFLRLYGTAEFLSDPNSKHLVSENINF